jgi:hypothetical protein
MRRQWNGGSFRPPHSISAPGSHARPSRLLVFELLEQLAPGGDSRGATAAINARDHQAGIAKVQEWLGHANTWTTRIYDHCKIRPEVSPPFKVAY